MTQLEFTQAMTDFKVMFPDMDADVIEAVLRANQVKKIVSFFFFLLQHLILLS